MSVRVRFAPSPTGHLHIGGARTAIYGHLAARAAGGQFLLRIEDTDQARSRKEYEEAMIEDLRWCGLSFDQAPCRQSERLKLYQSVAQDLAKRGHAYPCFLSPDELEKLTAQAENEGLAPHAYHGRFRDMNPAEAQERITAGENFVLRFKNPDTSWNFTDLVRGEVSFPPDMVGDFVLLRSDGRPVYNFCCVVDDWKMGITHVIRGEEHLNNTVRQLMLYAALEVPPPQFAHCSLLVDENRQKLSKRSAATSVGQYRREGYLPQALANYLCLLGHAHPEGQDIFTLEEATSWFQLRKLHKSPAIYDLEKLQHINGQHLRRLSDGELLNHCRQWIGADNPFHRQGEDWQKRFLRTFVEKINLPGELEPHLELIFHCGPAAEPPDASVLNYLRDEVQKMVEAGTPYPTPKDIEAWIAHLKGHLGLKGKALFQGLRLALTGHLQGPDLKNLISLTPAETLLQRLSIS